MQTSSLAAVLPGGLLLLVLLAAAAVFAMDATRSIAFPYPLDYGEGPLLGQSVRLGHLERAFLADIEPQAFAAILVYRIPDVPLHRTRWTGTRCSPRSIAATSSSSGSARPTSIVLERVADLRAARGRYVGRRGSSISQNF